MTVMIVRLTRIQPEQNQFRYYLIQVNRGLFGNWCLMREWGRMGSPGTVRVQWFSTIEDVEAAVEKLLTQKIKAGYTSTEELHSEHAC